MEEKIMYVEKKTHKTLNVIEERGTVAQAYTPSTQEVEARGLSESRGADQPRQPKTPL